MTRSIHAFARASTMFFFVALCMLICSRNAAAQDQAGASEPPVIGRLATVEPANRRITVVPEGEVEWVEMFVAVDGEVARESRELTLAELVIEVGRRVTVHYRIDGERRIAHRIILDPA